jgi:hypothetical protein
VPKIKRGKIKKKLIDKRPKNKGNESHRAHRERRENG